MFKEEIRKLLWEVLTSWQVLAVTGVLILYISIVNYVARLYRSHSSRRISVPKIKAEKAGAEAFSPTDSEGLDVIEENAEE